MVKSGLKERQSPSDVPMQLAYWIYFVHELGYFDIFAVFKSVSQSKQLANFLTPYKFSTFLVAFVSLSKVLCSSSLLAYLNSRALDK